MTNLNFEGYMGKNNPETFASRARSEGGRFGSDSQSFAGAGPRSVEAFAANVNSRRSAKRETLKEAGSGALRMTSTREAGVDFGDVIGKELQILYDDVVAQPVPDRFLNLLNMLEKNVLPSGGGK